MNAWADADHPRGRFGRFKAKFRTEPKDGLDDDRWASSPTSDITGWMLWQTAEGELHRVGGPAVIWVDGYQEWYLHGKRHRIDGPAVILTDGTFEWWENDVRKPPEVEAALTMIWLARTP